MTTAAEAAEDAVVGTAAALAGQLAVGAGQVDERRDRAQHRRDGGGDVEGAVDRLQAALTRSRLGDVDADDGGDGADGRHDQREHEALGAERGAAEDQGGDQGHRVGLEQVGRHAGAVAYVVAHVVGDGGGVARVVLGDVLLHLAHQVGADVCGLGEDAAADPHEHGQQRGTEAEALEDRGGVTLVEQHDGRGTEEPQADGHHADEGAGAERDAHGGVAALVAGGGGHADVRLDGEPHAEPADGGREAGADQEEQ